MNTPTSNAPHICLNVLLKISPSWRASSLPASPSNAAMISHDARMALPPTHGANLNAAAMVALVSGASAVTCAEYQPTAGKLDHGPVQLATTTMSTMKGIQASSTS